MAPLVGMSIDVYTPSLPAISHYFQISNTLTKYTVIIYLLGYGLGQFFYGPLSDSFGRRKLLLTGIFFFIIGSIIAGFSLDMFVLLSARFMQGLSIAALGVIVRAIPVDCFSGKKLATVISYITFSWSVGPIVSPFIGGYLQHYIGWQANFYFLAIYGMVLWLFIYFTLPETNQNFIPFNVMNILKSFYEILSNQIFISSVIIMTFTYSILTIFNITGPFLIQNVLKYSPIAYGHIALVMGFAFFIGTFVNRCLIQIMPSCNIIIVNLINMLMVSIIMLMLGLANQFDLFSVTVPVFLLLFGAAFVIPNCMSFTLSLFPNMSGVASALIGSLIMIGSAFITAGDSVLKTNTQLPMSITYVTFSVVCSVLYILILIQKTVSHKTVKAQS